MAVWFMGTDRCLLFAFAVYLCLALGTIRYSVVYDNRNGEQSQVSFLRPPSSSTVPVPSSVHETIIRTFTARTSHKTNSTLVDGLVESATAHSVSAPALSKDSQHHAPNFFSQLVPVDTMLKRRNPMLLSVYTGCSIAAWTYPWDESKPRMGQYYDDCGMYHKELDLRERRTLLVAASDLQNGDVVYVELMKLDMFVRDTLPNLNDATIVLISGQNHIAPMHPPLKPPYGQKTFSQIINSPFITHWFMMNLDKHAHNPFHPKMHPFPYGLSRVAKGGGMVADFIPIAQSAYQNEVQQTNNITKTSKIFVGYISPKSNPDRANVPSSPKLLSPAQYYRAMHTSEYILSPNGDRPECYRHYEAIGLGTKPITQLHPFLYRHLNGNVVFNTTTWNVTELEATLPSSPMVNRRLITQEYWMEYVERVVGRPLRWWDTSRNTRSTLEEITRHFQTTMKA